MPRKVTKVKNNDDDIDIYKIVLDPKILKIEKKYDTRDNKNTISQVLEELKNNNDIESMKMYILYRSIKNTNSYCLSSINDFTLFFNEYVKHKKISNQMLKIYFDNMKYKYRYNSVTTILINNDWIDVMTNTYKYKFTQSQMKILQTEFHYYNENIITSSNDVFYMLFFNDKIVETYLNDTSKITNLISTRNIKTNPLIILEKIFSIKSPSDKSHKYINNALDIIKKIFPLDSKTIHDIALKLYEFSYTDEFYNFIKENDGMTEELFVSICTYVIDHYISGSLIDNLLMYIINNNKKIKVTKYKNVIGNIIYSIIIYRIIGQNFSICTRDKCKFYRFQNKINYCLNFIAYIMKNNIHSYDGNKDYKINEKIIDELSNKFNVKIHTISCNNIVHFSILEDSEDSEEDLEEDSKEITNDKNTKEDQLNSMTSYLVNLFSAKFDIPDSDKYEFMLEKIKTEIYDIEDIENLCKSKKHVNLCIKYICHSNNIKFIKYLLNNKIIVPTLEHVMYLNFDSNYSDNILDILEILSLFSNYGLKIDKDLIFLLCRLNIINDSNIDRENATEFQTLLIKKAEEYNCIDKINTSTKKNIDKDEHNTTLLQKEKMFLEPYKKFKIIASQYNLEDFKEYFNVSLNNESDLLVFEYLVDHYNYKPTLIDIIKIYDTCTRYVMAKRFLSNLL